MQPSVQPDGVAVLVVVLQSQVVVVVGELVVVETHETDGEMTPDPQYV